MIYKIENWEQAVAFEKWAKENNIQIEKLDEGNYVEECPECGDYEFWHNGHCGHCGYDIKE